jgi:hypothetical protein
MVIAAVCQPLAARPANIVRFAASSSRWKRLRVELTGEGPYLAFIDVMRSAGEALAHTQIVEIKATIRTLHFRFDHTVPPSITAVARTTDGG